MSKLIKKNETDFKQILLLITDAKSRVYAKANSELVILYFNVGKIVSEKVYAGSWGDNTVQELADFIAAKHPELSGFNRRGLYRMRQFYETYSSPLIVSTVLTQLQSTENDEVEFVSAVPTQIQNKKKKVEKKVSAVPTLLTNQTNLQRKLLNNILSKISWANHLEILSATKTAEEKLYYLLGCITEKWSMRDLRRQIKSANFERTMLSNKNISQTAIKLPQNLFKDPYIFEFLNLPDTHSEKDFEKAIVLNLQKFILEVGKGFTYMGRQYRLQVGNKDYYTDLLFFHRDLQCLVLFELKIQEFEPEFLGKLNFYMEALDRDVKRPNEKASIGILLCKGKDTEVVEYAMARNTSPALITEYETKLIDKKLLADKLNQLASLLNKEIDE